MLLVYGKHMDIIYPVFNLESRHVLRCTGGPLSLLYVVAQIGGCQTGLSLTARCGFSHAIGSSTADGPGRKGKIIRPHGRMYAEIK